MTNILWFTNPHDVPNEGQSDMKLVDEDYFIVDGQMLHSAFVVLDTPRNRELLHRYREDYLAWQSLEPNMHDVLNALDKGR